MKLQVLTANALVEGDVVYLTATGLWARSLRDAKVYSDPETAQAALDAAVARTGEVVGVYLMDVTLDGKAPQPAHFREAFREKGPSNRFHGKQADNSEQSDVSLQRV